MSLEKAKPSEVVTAVTEANVNLNESIGADIWKEMQLSRSVKTGDVQPVQVAWDFRAGSNQEDQMYNGLSDNDRYRYRSMDERGRRTYREMDDAQQRRMDKLNNNDRYDCMRMDPRDRDRDSRCR